MAKEVVVKGKTYNKEDLITKMVEVNGGTKAEAKKAIDDFFKGVEALAENLSPKDKIQLVGKMGVECIHREARDGHNPRNPKEIIPIPAKNVLKITFGSDVTGKVKQPEAKKAKKEAKAKK